MDCFARTLSGLRSEALNDVCLFKAVMLNLIQHLSLQIPKQVRNDVNFVFSTIKKLGADIRTQ